MHEIPPHFFFAISLLKLAIHSFNPSGRLPPSKLLEECNLPPSCSSGVSSIFGSR